MLREISSLDVPEHLAAHLPHQSIGDPDQIVPELRDQAWLGEIDARWLQSWFDHLRRWQPTHEPTRLTHGDASPSNVLVDPATGAVTALLDWGDTAICQPAVDLAKVPPARLPAAIAGYTSRDATTPAAGAEASVSWAAGALWHHLTWAVGRLSTSPRPDDHSWSAPPAARLIGLLQLLAELPREWQALLPPNDTASRHRVGGDEPPGCRAWGPRLIRYDRAMSPGWG